ncbi:Acetyl-CoA carboxylase 1 [Camellia lanceoleosa]|uniref:Acetyl-CoA carboxylase 1 n=1 Tax=Camellia lanceoleosa TaxID=1840588 RepID=A0ACC0G9A6_9ERIC|nr:Acetyl-CoA carboxylase 1 [Camellia lanceoleosa]
MEHGGGYNAWRRTSVFATTFDFDKAESTRPKGHCVAMHVTNEDPDDGFKPTSGKVQELSFKSKPNVWAYFSVKSGGGIHEFSDSQFGHIFAFGESRALAIANMILGLKEIQIRGEIRTNVDYTIDLLHKASTSSAAMVSEYVGYLEKGKIPPKVPFVVDQAGCNANEDINFRFTGLTVSGRVVGSVGGESCSNKNGGPSNVNVELLSPTGDLVTSVLTSPTGSYPFTNIILEHRFTDLTLAVLGFRKIQTTCFTPVEVELGFENGLVDDIFFLPGYNIRGSVVAQAALIFDMLMLHYSYGLIPKLS